MKRYIDKDEALKSVSWDTESYQAINMIPSVDAVRVVRCQDCAYYVKDDDLDLKVCDYHIGERYVRWPGDFCSRGERREDDEKRS